MPENETKRWIVNGISVEEERVITWGTNPYCLSIHVAIQSKIKLSNLYTPHCVAEKSTSMPQHYTCHQTSKMTKNLSNSTLAAKLCRI